MVSTEMLKNRQSSADFMQIRRAPFNMSDVMSLCLCMCVCTPEGLQAGHANGKKNSVSSQAGGGREEGEDEGGNVRQRVTISGVG